MNTKRRRLYIALSILIILASFSALMYTRWNTSPRSMRFSWYRVPPEWFNEPLNEEVQPGQFDDSHWHRGDDLQWHWGPSGGLLGLLKEMIQPGQSYIPDGEEESEIVILTETYFDKDGECVFDFVFRPIDWVESFRNQAYCSYYYFLTKIDKPKLSTTKILLLRFWLKRLPPCRLVKNAQVHVVDLFFEGNSEGKLVFRRSYRPPVICID